MAKTLKSLDTVATKLRDLVRAAGKKLTELNQKFDAEISNSTKRSTMGKKNEVLATLSEVFCAVVKSPLGYIARSCNIT